MMEDVTSCDEGCLVILLVLLAVIAAVILVLIHIGIL